MSKPGRPEGSTQDVVNYRKSLKQLEQLHKQINDDVLDAYNVMISLLKKEGTKDSVRKSIAKDLIALFMEFSAEADTVLDKPSNRHQEKQEELRKKAASIADKKVVSFN